MKQGIESAQSLNRTSPATHGKPLSLVMSHGLSRFRKNDGDLSESTQTAKLRGRINEIREFLALAKALGR